MRTMGIAPRRRRRRALALVLGFILGAPGLALADGISSESAEAAGEGEGHEAGEVGEAHGHHEDPSRDFNWFHLHWGKDIKGGKLDDGKLGTEPLPAGEKEEPMSAPFVLMVVNFILLLVILGRFGAPAARKMAEGRSDQIKSALDDASKLRAQAKAKLDEYSAKLAASDAEIKKMIEGMRTDAEDDRKRVIAAAEVQAAALKKDAEERIAAEIERARHALAREVAVAASAAAETLLRDKATAGDQGKLVDGFIKELGGTAAAPRERS